MTFSYNLDTPVGDVRALIPDRDPLDPAFSDEEILTYLRIESNNTRRAAAMCIEVLAVDTVRALKVVKILQMSTDGAKMAASFLDRAALLRKQADADDAKNDVGPTFDIAEMVSTPFAYDEALLNDALRGL